MRKKAKSNEEQKTELEGNEILYHGLLASALDDIKKTESSFN